MNKTSEKNIYTAKMHRILLVLSCIFGFLILICALLLLFVSIGTFIVMFSFAIFIFLLGLIPFLTTKLGFTNKRVFGKIGLINTKTLDSPLNKINDISVSSGLGGKIFGYGTIVVTTSSGTYSFKTMANPNKFKELLMKQIDKFDDDNMQKQANLTANAIGRTINRK